MGVSMETDRLWTLFQVDQQRIGALETIMITVRGWTITLVSALVGFSLSQHHRSLLPVAMVGTVLFGLLDVGYMRTLLLHASRASKIEQAIAPEYRLRPHYHEWRPWRRYGSSVSVYVAVLLLLLLLWIVT
jgi:uncharacterized membrane protein